MARIRTVKPDMWTDERFVECSTNARLLFVGGLNFANDYGVLADSPKRLKMQVFPGDDFDVPTVENLIDELVFHGLWERGEHPSGRKVLLIRGFAKHQRVDKPNDGDFGDPAKWHQIPGTFDEQSTNTQGTFDDDSPPEGKGREGTNTSSGPPKDDYPPAFEAAWELYPRKEAKQAALKAWKTRIKQGAIPEDLETATRHFKSAMRHRRKEHIKVGSTFYGPDEHWRDYMNPESAQPDEEETPREHTPGNDQFVA